MAASTLVDLVRVNVASTGAGIITLGTAVAGYRGALALVTGTTYSYSIIQGLNWEVGQGVYTASGTTFSRLQNGTGKSSNTDAPIDLTSGAIISITALAADIVSTGALAGVNGAALVGSQAPGANAVPRTLAARVGDAYRTPEDFGATGIESDDQTTALNRWIAAIDAGAVGRLLSRDYRFNSALVLGTQDDRTIIGDNSYKSRLLYTGSTTNLDLVTLGAAGVETLHWTMRDFMIDSETTLTGGYALRLIKTIFCDYDGVIFTGQYGAEVRGGATLYNGIFFDGFHYDNYSRLDNVCRNVGVSICGKTSTAYGAGLFITGGKISVCTDGMLIGGAAGGITVDDLDIIANSRDGIRFDTSLVALGNNQSFFKSGLTVDTCGRDGIRLDDSLAGAQFLDLDGTWTASHAAYALNVLNWGNAATAIINLKGINAVNNALSAVRIATSTPSVFVNGGCLEYNSGYGMLNSAGGGNITVQTVPGLDHNTAGPYSGRFIGLSNSFTSAVTATGGSGLSAAFSLGEYTLSGEPGAGQRVTWSGKIVVTTVGTATGLRITLPATARSDRIQVGNGFNTNNGEFLAVTTQGNNADIYTNRNLPPVTGNGQTLYINGDYLV